MTYMVNNMLLALKRDFFLLQISQINYVHGIQLSVSTCGEYKEMRGSEVLGS